MFLKKDLQVVDASEHFAAHHFPVETDDQLQQTFDREDFYPVIVSVNLPGEFEPRRTGIRQRKTVHHHDMDQI